MVSKKYFCYTCDKTKKKLISVQDFEEWGLQCDECGEGFCEILDQDNKDLIRQLKESGRIKKVEVAPQSMINTLGASRDQAFAPPRVSGVRENIRNTNL